MGEAVITRYICSIVILVNHSYTIYSYAGQRPVQRRAGVRWGVRLLREPDG